MIDPASYPHYVCWALSVAGLGVALVRVQAMAPQIITTKEFQSFVRRFYRPHAVLILCELLQCAYLYSTTLAMGLSVGEIANLFVTAQVATTALNLFMEGFDLISRKSKCMLCGLLYAAGASTLFAAHGHDPAVGAAEVSSERHPHLELLLVGRVLTGCATSLLHSSFEAYLINEHTMNGFPDEWLSHTFSVIGFSMAGAAVGCGVLGQLALHAVGPAGPSMLTAVLGVYAALLINSTWSRDTFTPRFTMSSFLHQLGGALSKATGSGAMISVLLIQASFEAAAIAMTFYWAYWLALGSGPGTVPFGLVFSSLTAAATSGSFVQQVLASRPVEQTLSAVLMAAAAAFLAGATVSGSFMALLCCMFVQVCVGMYWPCIGFVRGKVVPTEYRSACLVVTRSAAVGAAAAILLTSVHAPLVVLLSCAALCGAAAYFHVRLEYASAPPHSLPDSADPTPRGAEPSAA